MEYSIYYNPSNNTYEIGYTEYDLYDHEHIYYPLKGGFKSIDEAIAYFKEYNNNGEDELDEDNIINLVELEKINVHNAEVMDDYRKDCGLDD